MPALIAKIKGRWQPKPGEPKITRGHINRAINYALEPGKERPRVIGGQGLEYQITDEETARRAGRDMEDLGNPSAPGPRPNPLFHMILSWEDNPTDEHMVETGRSALQHLGMDRAQGVFVRHHDTNNHHMHFVGSRVDPETGVTFRSMQNWSKDRTRLDEWRRDREREYKREHEPKLERSPPRKMLEWARGYEREHERSLDRSWLKTPENFREFADAHGLGRVSQQEAKKLKNDHANERMLSDFDYFSKLDRDKPERTPALEHQNEPAEGMPFYSPAGAKVVNRVLNERERPDWNELEPVEKAAMKKDSRERGMGREMDIFGFDDGSSRGESGYGGD